MLNETLIQKTLLSRLARMFLSLSIIYIIFTMYLSLSIIYIYNICLNLNVVTCIHVKKYFGWLFL
jgi:hypothetical protein